MGQSHCSQDLRDFWSPLGSQSSFFSTVWSVPGHGRGNNCFGGEGSLRQGPSRGLHWGRLHMSKTDPHAALIVSGYAPRGETFQTTESPKTGWFC